MSETHADTGLVVIGGGPGGYAAAFRAADLGLDVTLISDEDSLGGVCLHRGCIPSKALLSLCGIMDAAHNAGAKGVSFQRPKIQLKKIRAWKTGLLERLATGLDGLSDKRHIKRIKGRARFTGRQTIAVEGSNDGEVRFRHAIVATGSLPQSLPGTDFEFEKASRIMDSTAALELTEIPSKLLVIGGGYVGLELGQMYAALGSRVTLVEASERLLGNVDADLVKRLQQKLEQQFDGLYCNTSVRELRETAKRVRAELEGDVDGRRDFDRVLVAVGRTPNTRDLGLDEAGIDTDEHGFIEVDMQRCSSNAAVYAIGDAAGGMMLAHEAMHEGRVAAEAIAGKATAYDVVTVPAVVYTHPQIAWCGLTQQQAQLQEVPVEVSGFAWQASGRALMMDGEDGMTKLVCDPESGLVLGVGMVGPGVENLIAEAVLAVEMGALAEDIALTMHPHPTLTETLAGAAEAWSQK